MRADDEDGQRLLEAAKTFEIQIGASHNVDGAGLGEWFVAGVNLVDLRGIHVDGSQNVALQIEQCTHLHRGLLGSVARQWEQGKTQIDGAAIEGVDGLLHIHAEVLVGVKPARRGDHPLRRSGVNPKVAGFDGTGGRAAPDVTANAEMTKVRPKASMQVPMSSRLSR